MEELKTWQTCGTLFRSSSDRIATLSLDTLCRSAIFYASQSERNMLVIHYPPVTDIDLVEKGRDISPTPAVHNEGPPIRKPAHAHVN